MQLIKLIFIFLLFFCISSFVNKKLTPLTFLKDNDVLILKKSIIGFKNYVDTLDANRIIDFSYMEFESKNYNVEKYGVTPDYSINIFDKNERVCLLSIWNIENGKIAVNINYLKLDKFYSGYVIDKNLFNSKITFND